MAGLTNDPFAIGSEQWLVEPDYILNVEWSDVFLYMVSTPSEYTKEEIKVSNSTYVLLSITITIGSDCDF